MKSLLIYTGPKKKFGDEDLTLLKIQIDNNYDLGRNSKDIILAADFPFEYNGVKSFFLPDHLYYDFDLNANKIPVMIYLSKRELIDPKELYWCHDFDAFENEKIKEEELALDDFDLGLIHYTYKPEWQFGSLFFKTSAQNIFELIHAETLKKPHFSRNNEKVLTKLIKENKIDSKRYKRLDTTYNVMKKFLPTIYPLSQKPIRVVHFRPTDALGSFMYGENRLKIPIMSDRLIKIFKQHGIK